VIPVHAESSRSIYDPSQVSYGKLLQIFFSVAHDPTQLNRQGPDHGTQYARRSSTASPAAASGESYIKQLTAANLFASNRDAVVKLGGLSG